jgi:hypothetical protein
VRQPSHEPAFINKEQNEKDYDATHKYLPIHLLLCDELFYVSDDCQLCTGLISSQE